MEWSSISPLVMNLSITVLVVSAGSSFVAFAGDLKMTEADLRRDGAYAFPQAQAQVLCDVGDLRVSIWNNSEYLYVQAILWNDDDSALGKMSDGRAIGDHSEIDLDLDADEQRTANVDRSYLLDPWPALPGLRYQIVRGPHSWTAIQNDSKGRGAIRYAITPENRRIRIDSFLVPLKELSRKVGDKIRLAYYGSSPRPELTLNSAGFDPGHPYWGYNIPQGSYHDYFIIKSDTLNFSAGSVPDGRHDPLPQGVAPR